MFSKLMKADFWVGVIVVLIALRVAERMVPAIKVVTNPGAKTSTNG